MQRSGAKTAASGSTAATQASQAAATEGTADVPDNSIAVLPFVNMSGDPSADYFSDGISEEILNVLAGTPDLQVAARTSSFAFKGQQKEIPVIARELKVRMILEGSVRRQDQKVRITAQLIDAKTGFHVWSETYDRELKDIFAIQDEIAKAIGSELKVQVFGTRPSGAASVGAKMSRRMTTTCADSHSGNAGARPNSGRRSMNFRAPLPRIPDTPMPMGGSLSPTPSSRTIRAGSPTGMLCIGRLMPPKWHSRSIRRSRRPMRHSGPWRPTRDVARPSVRCWSGPSHCDHRSRLRINGSEQRPWRPGTRQRASSRSNAQARWTRVRWLSPRTTPTPLTVLGRYEDAISVCQPIIPVAPDYFQCQLRAGMAELLRSRPEAARPYLVAAARAGNPSALPLVNELVNTVDGHGDRQALARRLAAFPVRSFVEPGSGNLFSDTEMPILLMVLGAPDIALSYVERHSSEPFGSLDWAMVDRSLDPIRCDPRFQQAAKNLAINDLRAAKLCAGTGATRD